MSVPRRPPRRQRRRHPREATIEIIVVAFALLLVSSCDPSSRWTIWHWNVAGGAMHDGSTQSGMVSRAVGSILSRGADFATFNELCETQYHAILAGLRAAGWPYNLDNFARFEPNAVAPDDGELHCGVQNEPPRNPLFSSPRGRQGNAIFSKRPLGTATVLTLPYAGETLWGVPEQRRLLCAPLAALPQVRICTTHITTVDDMKSVQLIAVRDQLHAFGGTWILAGDLNVQPHYGRLDRFYAPSVDSAANSDNYGRCRELDDRDSRYPEGMGEPTGGGAKIDFIFVPESRIVSGTPYDMDALAIAQDCSPKNGAPACSDHNAVVGHVTVWY